MIFFKNDINVNFKIRAQTILITILVTGNIILLTHLISYSKNTLAENSRWVSIKPLMGFSLMGALNFVHTRNALANNKLHLGAWFGFQELYFKEKISPQRISFSFENLKKNYFFIVLRESKNIFFSIRISSNPQFPSAIFEGINLYEDRVIKRIDISNILKDKNFVEIVASTNNQNILLINNNKIAVFPSIKPALYLGFRSTAGDIIIDTVQIKTNDGKIIEEDFSNHKNSVIYIILSILIVIGFQFLTVIFLRKKNFYFLFVSNILLLFLLLSYNLFDYYHWSRLYHNKQTTENVPKVIEILEAFRKNVFLYPNMYSLKNTDFSALTHSFFIVGEKNIIQYPVKQVVEFFDQTTDIKKENEITSNQNFYTVMLLGTSQTFGMGASNLNASLAAKTYYYLNKHSKKVLLWNCSYPGYSSSTILDKFNQYCSKAKPNLLIINLGNNDSDPKILVENLQKIIKLGVKEKIKLVFSLEANSLEKTPWCSNLSERHKVMVSLANKHQIPIFNANKLLQESEKSDSAQLWWDCVHLTDKGQDFFAKNLSKFILKKINIF